MWLSISFSILIKTWQEKNFNMMQRKYYTFTRRVRFQNLPGGALEPPCQNNILALLELVAKIISLHTACVNSRSQISHGHKVAYMSSCFWRQNQHNTRRPGSDFTTILAASLKSVTWG